MSLCKPACVFDTFGVSVHPCACVCTCWFVCVCVCVYVCVCVCYCVPSYKLLSVISCFRLTR